MAGKIQGRRAWSYATWARYVAAGKTPAEVRRRLELARLEAPNGATPDLERAADRKLSLLEDRPVSTADASALELEAIALEAPAVSQADGADAQGGGGSWWWE